MEASKADTREQALGFTYGGYPKSTIFLWAPTMLDRTVATGELLLRPSVLGKRLSPWLLRTAAAAAAAVAGGAALAAAAVQNYYSPQIQLLP